MSKSLNNGIDPLDVVALYGADALRYTLISGMGLGADTILDPEDLERSFAPGRNFATKLWNIGRFLLGNVGSSPVLALEAIAPSRLTRADRWILARLDDAVRECDAALGPARPQGGQWTEEERHAGLRLNEYTEAARRFVWSELADWYLESTKARLAAPGDDREVARAVLVHAFDAALRLLQPIVPFVTDALWQRLPGRGEREFLAVARWPRPRGRHDGADFELAREAVSAIRKLRGDYRIPPGKMLQAMIRPAAGGPARDILTDEAALIGRLSASGVSIVDAAPEEAAAHHVLSDGSEVVLPLAGTIDLEKECARLRGELAGLEKQLASLSQRLRNESFLSRAKPEVVEGERQKQRDWSARRDQLSEKVRALCGG